VIYDLKHHRRIDGIGRRSAFKAWLVTLRLMERYWIMVYGLEIPWLA